jgi:uncharacterized membrane protein
VRRLRNYFITGLIVILPIVASIYIVWLLFNTFDSVLGSILAVFIGERITGLGAVLTLGLILITGLLATNYLGKKIIELGEKVIAKIPLIRPIYSTAKQIVDSFVMTNKQAFQKVVMLEYPRKGVYALAFVTGVASGEVQAKTNEEVLNVFIPTTPNPTSGFLLLVPKKDVIELDMSVEDGLKLIISAGVLNPEGFNKKNGKGKTEEV